ncbi:MAG: amidohydrolase family protein [Pseudomonadota bacterium]
MSTHDFPADLAVIDCHTHAWRPREWAAIQALSPFLDPGLEENSPYNWTPRFEGALDALLAEERKAGIAEFVLLPVAGRSDKCRELTRWVAQSAAEHPEIIPFGALHPHSLNQAEDLDLILSLGLKGVKLHSLSQRFDPLSPPARRTYALCEKHGLIVLMDSMDVARAVELKPNLREFKAQADELGLENGPEKIAVIAREHPGLTIIAAHLGCCYGWDRIDPLLDLDNVYFDLAVVHRLISPDDAGAIIRKKGAARVIFGSDAPYRRPENALQWTLGLDLTETEFRLILGDNLRRLLR